MEWFEFTYPKIPADINAPTGLCVAYEKLDGTNLGWPWKRGFGFGPPTTRSGLLSRQDENLKDAFTAFKRIHRNLDRVLARKTTATDAKVFFEFLGPGSFAGLHVFGAAKRLVLIDVALSGQGLMGPAEFLETFVDEEVELAPALYCGSSAGQAISDVLSGKHGDIEGTVVKGGKTGAVWMLKVKTEAWKRRLREMAENGRWTASDGVERLVSEDS